ncbi:hypothetical protein EJ110_NYTH46535 [Nymphaea thermarum]|nr:hypothetical protein EJ110_NYTH46535 [Nymphaea thermarum]
MADKGKGMLSPTGSGNVESSSSSVNTATLEKDNPQQPLWRYVKKLGKGPGGGGNAHNSTEKPPRKAALGASKLRNSRTGSRQERNAQRKERQEGVALLVLISTLGDPDEVDAVPDDAILYRLADRWPPDWPGGMVNCAGYW